MDDNNVSNRQLIPIKDNKISTIGSALNIANKFIFNGIEKLFNEAFYLINSKHLKEIEENYCLLIEYDDQYLKNKKFHFDAESDDNV